MSVTSIKKRIIRKYRRDISYYIYDSGCSDMPAIFSGQE